LSVERRKKRGRGFEKEGKKQKSVSAKRKYEAGELRAREEAGFGGKWSEGTEGKRKDRKKGLVGKKGTQEGSQVEKYKGSKLSTASVPKKMEGGLKGHHIKDQYAGVKRKMESRDSLAHQGRQIEVFFFKLDKNPETSKKKERSRTSRNSG